MFETLFVLAVIVAIGIWAYMSYELDQTRAGAEITERQLREKTDMERMAERMAEENILIKEQNKIHRAKQKEEGLKLREEAKRKRESGEST